MSMYSNNKMSSCTNFFIYDVFNSIEIQNKDFPNHHSSIIYKISLLVYLIYLHPLSMQSSKNINND